MLDFYLDLPPETAFAPAAVDHVHSERQIVSAAVALARQQIDCRIDRKVTFDMLLRVVGPQSALLRDLAHSQRRDRFIVAAVWLHKWPGRIEIDHILTELIALLADDTPSTISLTSQTM